MGQLINAAAVRCKGHFWPGALSFRSRREAWVIGAYPTSLNLGKTRRLCCPWSEVSWESWGASSKRLDLWSWCNWNIWFWCGHPDAEVSLSHQLCGFRKLIHFYWVTYPSFVKWGHLHRAPSQMLAKIQYVNGYRVTLKLQCSVPSMVFVFLPYFHHLLQNQAALGQINSSCDLEDAMPSRSHHFMANRWGNSGNRERVIFGGLQNHCRWWLQPWN